MHLRTWPATLLLLLTGVSSAVPTQSLHPGTMVLTQRKEGFPRKLTRNSQFIGMRHISSLPPCSEVQPPEALTTPDPLYTSAARGQKVKVSFIIGIDGRVHSPLILQSGGLAGDRHILSTVRTWRYRPAMCNGVPTETEGKIEFSNR